MSLPGTGCMDRATGSYMALSVLNPAEAEVHLPHSRAKSVLLHWILFDVNWSFEGAVF